MPALGVAAAAGELSAAPALLDERASALRTLAALEHLRLAPAGRSFRRLVLVAAGEVPRVPALGEAGATDEVPASAEAYGERPAALGTVLVDALLGHLLTGHRLALEPDLPFEVPPELVEYRDPGLPALGDRVEVVLHARGEAVVHVAAEMLGQEPADHPPDVGRMEPALLELHVLPLLELRDDVRVGRGAADPAALELADQGRLGVPRRGPGEVLLGPDVGNGDHLALGELRQPDRPGRLAGAGGRRLSLGAGRSVHRAVRRRRGVLVHGEIARRGDGGAGRPKDVALAAAEVHRHVVHHRVLHLARHRPPPDELVDAHLVAGQGSAQRLRGSARRGRPHRLVRFLRVARPGAVPGRRRGHRIGAEAVGEERTDFRYRIRREAHRVGPHVGDEAFPADAFVELLRDPHCAAHVETEPVRRLLLQGRGGERSGRRPAPLLRADGQHLETPGGMQPERRLGGERGPLVGERELLHLLAPVLREPGVERRRAGRVREHRPVLASLERLDLGLPVGNEAKGGALHPSSGEVRADLRPQHRRQVEPDEVVEGAAGELGVHQVGLKLSRMLERLADRAPCDLVELYPVHRLVLEHPALGQELGDVPRNRLALAVGIGGEIESARAPHGPHDRLHVGLRARHQLEVHGEAALRLDRPGGGNEVAHVPVGGEDGEVRIQVLPDGAGLRWGLDDEEPPPPRPATPPALAPGSRRGGRAGPSLRSAGGGRSGGLTSRGHSEIRFVSVAGGQHTRM